MRGVLAYLGATSGACASFFFLTYVGDKPRHQHARLAGNRHFAFVAVGMVEMGPFSKPVFVFSFLKIERKIAIPNKT